MSTRCQIEFVSGDGKEDRNLTYRHSDGYPDGVIPDLKKFKKWLHSKPLSRIDSDKEYIAANWIYWCKMKIKEDFEQMNKKLGTGKKDGEGWEKLGYGICPLECFHGDIEYFYTIDVRKAKTWDIVVYEIRQEDWRKPITRKDFVEIKKETI